VNHKEIFAVILLLIVAGILFIVGLMAVVNPEIFRPALTTSYENISVIQAHKILDMNDTKVIDIRGLEGCGTCQFNKGHLPGALRYTDPTELYNLSNTLLIYSVNGIKGEWFCEQLMGHVYGKVYNLAGGWNAWTN